MPTLFIFSGLPGAGKTTLARKLAQRFSAIHLRIDTIEQGLRDLCHVRVEGEGYRLAYRIAADNLQLGLDVIADSCNPIELTRGEWESVARNNSAEFVNIEVVCSDRDEHRRRVETRAAAVPGLQLPTWDEVAHRQYDAWTRPRIAIDTAHRTSDKCLDDLTAHLRRSR
ncbi:MAG: AAA family ATPase [Pirellulaceae bacterium]|nr:AAA family ATPase [Planctomycetales bacterium]